MFSVTTYIVKVTITNLAKTLELIMQMNARKFMSPHCNR